MCRMGMQPCDLEMNGLTWPGGQCGNHDISWTCRMLFQLYCAARHQPLLVIVIHSIPKSKPVALRPIPICCSPVLELKGAHVQLCNQLLVELNAPSCITMQIGRFAFGGMYKVTGARRAEGDFRMTTTSLLSSIELIEAETFRKKSAARAACMSC